MEIESWELVIGNYKGIIVLSSIVLSEKGAEAGVIILVPPDIYFGAPNHFALIIAEGGNKFVSFV